MIFGAKIVIFLETKEYFTHNLVIWHIFIWSFGGFSFGHLASSPISLRLFYLNKMVFVFVEILHSFIFSFLHFLMSSIIPHPISQGLHCSSAAWRLYILS